MLEAIMSNSPAGIAVFEGETGNCELANQAIADVVGGSIDAILHQNFRTLKSWRAVGLDKLAEMALVDGIARHHETTLETSFGKKTIVDCFISRLELEDKAHLLFIVSNISERKSLEAQLLQSQKMESIGRLAGGVAHDFNNMLTVILGCANLSMLKISEENDLWQYLKSIKLAAERSSDITRQLLAFSRNEIIAPKPVNLNTLITESEINLGRLIGEDIKVSFRRSTTLWTVKIDPAQLDQILMNLSVNARDAMPDGGSLTVETANVQLSGEYSRIHPDARPGDYVQLTVSDTGIGMDRETRDHIFEPFFTTKGVGKGTGLGLSTVYGIVTQNNGFINVYSEPGQGTVFTIHLPRLAEEFKVEEKVDSVAPTGSGTILLVEDEGELLIVTTELLEVIGYKVIQAETPQAAIAICGGDQIIDLILSDVVMPGMNGKAMSERIKTIRPNLKVLFMSGYTANIVSQSGIVEEGMHYIQKPFSMDQLNEKITQVLSER